MERPCVLVGVTGCIAAYKAGEIVRGLQKAGVRVKVVMTEHGTHFVDPVTFRALTHEKVAVEAPRCGMTMARSIFTTAGLAKSVTYAATLPDSSASAMATSSTSTSREKFRNTTPSFI